MRKGSSVCHILVFSSQPTQRAVCVCVCRRAQLFFYLGAKERERKVSRLLTWSLIAGTNSIHVLIVLGDFLAAIFKTIQLSVDLI